MASNVSSAHIASSASVGSIDSEWIDSELVVQHYGGLHDGLTFHDYTPDETARRLRQQYLNRLDLAILSRLGEGLTAHHALEDRKFDFTLLTPPNMVAVVDLAGKWTRVPRDTDIHGPVPYSHIFYQEYLRASGLPHWFFTSDHVNMLNMSWEAVHLNVLVDYHRVSHQPSPPTRDDIDYETGPPVRPAASPYRIDGGLPADIRNAIAVYYPAVKLNEPHFGVRVLPTGHIQLFSRDSETDDTAHKHEPKIGARNAFVVDGETAPFRASFFSEYVNIYQGGVLPGARRDDDESRVEILADLKKDGGVLNPTHNMEGIGHYRWLTEYDKERAFAMGFTHEAEITALRQNGTLASTEEPHVVWLPALQYLNPKKQPARRGRWAFLTHKDQQLARDRLGGRHEAYGLPSNLNAAWVWYYRSELVTDASEDLSEGINIHWIPGEQDFDRMTKRIRLHQEHRRRSPSPSPEPQPYRSFSAEEPFDPTNGEPNGPFDQTTDFTIYEPYYDVAVIEGRRWIVDRSIAMLDIPQPHLLYALGDSGWCKYPSIPKGGFDWSDLDQIKWLNLWRDDIHDYNPFLAKNQRTTVSPKTTTWGAAKPHIPPNFGPGPLPSVSALVERPKIVNPTASSSRRNAATASSWRSPPSEDDSSQDGLFSLPSTPGSGASVYKVFNRTRPKTPRHLQRSSVTSQTPLSRRPAIGALEEFNAKSTPSYVGSASSSNSRLPRNPGKQREIVVDSPPPTNTQRYNEAIAALVQQRRQPAVLFDPNNPIVTSPLRYKGKQPAPAFDFTRSSGNPRATSDPEIEAKESRAAFAKAMDKKARQLAAQPKGYQRKRQPIVRVPKRNPKIDAMDAAFVPDAKARLALDGPAGNLRKRPKRD